MSRKRYTAAEVTEDVLESDSDDNYSENDDRI